MIRMNHPQQPREYDAVLGEQNPLLEGASDNYYRLLRGGSWCSYPRHCRSACRHLDGTNLSNIVIGFRVGCRNPNLSK
ncbi:hypothetical protein [Nostoc sp.]